MSRSRNLIGAKQAFWWMGMIWSCVVGYICMGRNGIAVFGLCYIALYCLFMSCGIGRKEDK
jgi:hypothetical protein